jgi:hypothetical protein
MRNDFIHSTGQLTFLAIETGAGRFPAKRFLESLREDGWRDFCVAARVLATSLAIGRPPSGRARRVAGSRTGLFELRITPCGRRGPHARMLYIPDQNTIWCVRGLLKRERLPRRDIELADRTVRRWRSQH